MKTADLFQGGFVPVARNERGPESIRVIHKEEYLLQTWNGETWITQKVHQDKDVAIEDCEDWYE